MTFEMVVALHVADAQVYQQYRAAMRPLLEAAGGGFRYDFEVARTLRSEAAHPLTRVFTIHFRDRAAKDAFFADPEYKRIKSRFFETSVHATTIVAEYER
ncbi:MAG: DUF1330 domain-containing protein [Planctomycetes bacterium]|nr:DUF1330 domain-containing protein [Planctomycetota bacterium]